VAAGLEAAAAQLRERRQISRQRQGIIAANAELRERELTKLASYSAALAEALRGRGVEDPAAALLGEVAVAAFRIAVERWADETNRRELTEVIRESLDALKTLAGEDRCSPRSGSARPGRPREG
jgi:MftR C-terminal domain